MANKTLFKSLIGKLIPATDAVNEERAPAYALSPKHQLAQYAATGCLNSTFYASAGEQLKTVLDLCADLDAEFIAKTAVFCRERGYMKDMPALLCAVLSVKDRELLNAIFPRVIDNATMLRNFVQIMRSGVVGRKSLGSAPKRLVREWLDARSSAALFKANVGQDPSLADILKMVHPRPKDKTREALFGYFTGRDYAFESLPEVVRNFEAFRNGESLEVPDVPFQMLTSLPLGRAEWTAIARRAPWQMTRMNLNTFARHGVFGDPELIEIVANRLRDPQAIAKARVFPYQLLVAYSAATANADIPSEVCEALQDAMEIATENVPAIDGQVYVCPDVSGSMLTPVTGHRKGATTTVRCIDVAALVSAAVLRKNPKTRVLPFACRVVKITLSPRDSVMTNAERLAAIGGGGTNCSAPLARLNRKKAKGDLVIFVSDNESWVDADRGLRSWGTITMREWSEYKQRNPNARLVCIDVQPYRTVQAVERDDILNVGGFSDQVFDLISEFAGGRLNANHWIGVIDSVAL
jgi:60 kDa SS-A/Ro ribonucleoprotein